MKEIKFRPLRLLKNGKIAVASYPLWSRIMTADYNKFKLVIDQRYKAFPQDAYVHNHKGEQLFFYSYDPSRVQVYAWSKLLDLTELHNSGNSYAIQWDPFGHANYYMPGADCQGVPTFSHWTADDVAERVRSLSKVDDFEPLTVKMVSHWFGWMLYQLNNVTL